MITGHKKGRSARAHHQHFLVQISCFGRALFREGPGRALRVSAPSRCGPRPIRITLASPVVARREPALFHRLL